MQPSSPGAGSTDVKKVMISSTALDLPEHRNQVTRCLLAPGHVPTDDGVPARQRRRGYRGIAAYGQ